MADAEKAKSKSFNKKKLTNAKKFPRLLLLLLLIVKTVRHLYESLPCFKDTLMQT